MQNYQDSGAELTITGSDSPGDVLLPVVESLKAQATGGNAVAVGQLRQLMEEQRYQNLLKGIDDDETG